MTHYKRRLRKLELVLVVTKAPAHDEEFEIISHQDSAAFALLQKAEGIVRESVKDHPDQEALYADQKRLYDAMDYPALTRLHDCLHTLHARVDSLRKTPRVAGGVRQSIPAAR